MGKRSRASAKLDKQSDESHEHEPSNHAHDDEQLEQPEKKRSKKEKHKQREQSLISSTESSSIPIALSSSDTQAQFEIQTSEQARAQLELDRAAAKLRTQQAEVDARAAELQLREARLDEQQLNDSSDSGNITRLLADIIERERKLIEQIAQYDAEQELFLLEYETQQSDLSAQRLELEHAITQSFKQRVDVFMKQADFQRQGADEYAHHEQIAVSAADRAKHDAQAMYRSLHGVASSDNHHIVSQSAHSPISRLVVQPIVPQDAVRMPALEDPSVSAPTISPPVNQSSVQHDQNTDATLSWLQQLDHYNLASVPRVLQAMSNHLNDTRIQVAAMDVLYMMESSADLESTCIIKHGGLHVILAALKHHSGDSTVMASSQRLLSAISRTSEVYRQAIMSATGEDYSTMDMIDQSTSQSMNDSADCEASSKDLVALHVSNLSFSLLDDDLMSWVTRESGVTPIQKTIKRRVNGRNYGWGYIFVKSSDTAAVLSLDGRMMEDRKIGVEPARSTPVPIADHTEPSQQSAGLAHEPASVPESENQEQEHVSESSQRMSTRAERAARRMSRHAEVIPPVSSDSMQSEPASAVLESSADSQVAAPVVTIEPRPSVDDGKSSTSSIMRSMRLHQKSNSISGILRLASDYHLRPIVVVEALKSVDRVVQQIIKRDTTCDRSSEARTTFVLIRTHLNDEHIVHAGLYLLRRLAPNVAVATISTIFAEKLWELLSDILTSLPTSERINRAVMEIFLHFSREHKSIPIPVPRIDIILQLMAAKTKSAEIVGRCLSFLTQCDIVKCNAARKREISVCVTDIMLLYSDDSIIQYRGQAVLSKMDAVQSTV